MIRITIDSEVKKKLLSSNNIIELCDQEGQTLFRVRSDQNMLSENPSIDGWKKLTPDISADQFRQLQESDNWNGLTTPEVIDQLRNPS